MRTNQCGFLTVIYLLHPDQTNISKRIKLFNKTHNLITVDIRRVFKHRRANRKILQSCSSYHNKGKNWEKERYIEHFSEARFIRLSEDEKRRHTLFRCKECAANHSKYFLLKRGNTSDQVVVKRIAVPILSKSPENVCEADIDEVLKQVINPIKNLINNTPHIEHFYNSILGKRKINNINRISKKAKREIIKQANDEIKHVTLEKDFVAFYSSKQSGAEWNRQNKDSFGEYRKSKRKAHTGNLKYYEWSRNILFDELQEKDVKKWSALSRKVNLVVKSTQKPPGNPGQVVKQIAKSMGFHVKVRSTRPRTSWLNYSKMNLNIKRRTPILSLARRKKQMLELGAIDVGKPIVPIEYHVMKVEDGKPVKTIHEVSGRKFSLQAIRQDHLERMSQMNVLRKSNPDAMKLEEVYRFLQRHRISILDCENPREMMTKLMRTQALTCWHDHSEIAGNSHYLFMVWFLYDEVAYYSDQEFKDMNKLDYKVSVQATVEAPYMYLLARSGSSVKDQILYVPTRLEDLEELEKPVKLDGVEYHGVLRFFSGDTPARQLEAGQQRGGRYPCICGVEDAVFGDKALFNTRGPYQSLEDRCALLNLTDTWLDGSKDGTVAVYESLKTGGMRDELIARGVPLIGSENSVEIKQLFVKHFKGIQRPPALWCATEKVELPAYEIAMCEPLHDFKNVISCVIRELPHVTDNKELKAKLSSILKDIVVNREMKGTDCRLNIIRMAHTLFNHQDKSDGKKMYSLVMALIELQKLAYAPATQRSPRAILRAYNQSFVFALLCIDLFESPKSCSRRSIFGASMHALVVHLPEMLRLVSGRSFLAEHAERHFNKLRTITMRTSNRRADNIISNAIFRTAVERQKTDLFPFSTSFDSQDRHVCKQLDQSVVSKISSGLYLGCNTVLPNRSHNLKDVNSMLDKSWKDCLKDKDSTKIPLIQSPDSNISTASGNQPPEEILTANRLNGATSKAGLVELDYPLSISDLQGETKTDNLSISDDEKEPYNITSPYVCVLPKLAKDSSTVRNTSTGDLGTEDQSGLTNELGDADRTGATSKPGVTDIPGAADTPGATGKPRAADRPRTTGKPGATGKLGATDRPRTAYSVTDTVIELWESFYDKAMLEKFIQSEQKYELDNSAPTKSELCEAGKRIKPFLQKLQMGLKEKDNADMVELFRSKGFITLESSPVLKAQLKAVDQLLTKIK